MAVDDVKEQLTVTDRGDRPETSLDSGAGDGGSRRGMRASDLAIVAALLLPLILVAGVLSYRAVTNSGPAFECTPEHQALGHC